MKRRDFIGLAAAATTAGVISCSSADVADEAAADAALPEINWEMGTSWPLGLDTIYGGAVTFGETLSALTAGKFTVTPRAAGELVGGTEVLGAVEDGSLQAGHTASYYYVGKSPATAFGTALPFGMTARQNNAWFYEGGGLQLMQDFYRDRFGVIQFPAGNTGVQMGGWFNKELNSTADLAGLRMRIPGLGGQVMERLGVSVQLMPGGEVFGALQTGAIDAAEWVGPYDDQKMDFNSVTSYYYYPGWWEPGPALEFEMKADEYDALPEVYQAAISAAAYVANSTMLAKYDALNPPALEELLASDIEVRPFPDDVMQVSQEAAFSLYDELSQEDGDFKAIFGEWKKFRDSIQTWHGLAEVSMLDFFGRTQTQ